MGEAKRKLEEVRTTMLRVVEGWMLEPTEWEARMVAEVRRLPRIEGQRYPPHVLAYMKMKMGECHANAWFMEREDPDMLNKRVVGWTVTDGQFVLHSVVRRGEDMFCVTPAPRGAGEVLTFLPDSAIVCEEIDGRFVHLRGGERIKYGLRPDPAASIEFGHLLLSRLKSGMNPYKAMEIAPPAINVEADRNAQ